MASISDASTISELETFTYRPLQQKAKSMGLPSNVKKVYLVKLIHTKIHGTQEEVDQLVRTVKEERQFMSQVKRKRRRQHSLQGTEVSSTSDSCYSPSYTTSPKQASPVFTSSSRRYKRNLIMSDRVLRNKSRQGDFIKRPQYALDTNNKVIRIIDNKNHNNHTNTNTNWTWTLNTLKQDLGTTITKQQKANSQKNSLLKNPAYSSSVSISQSPVLTRKKQNISCICSVKDNVVRNTKFMKGTLKFKNKNGKLEELEAYIQMDVTRNRTLTSSATEDAITTTIGAANNDINIEFTIQDLLNSNINKNINDETPNTMQYPNLAADLSTDNEIMQTDSALDMCILTLNNGYAIENNPNQIIQDNNNYESVKVENLQNLGVERRNMETQSLDLFSDDLIQDAFNNMNGSPILDYTQMLHVQVRKQERIQSYITPSVVAGQPLLDGFEMLQTSANTEQVYNIFDVVPTLHHAPASATNTQNNLINMSPHIQVFSSNIIYDAVEENHNDIQNEQTELMPERAEDIAGDSLCLGADVTISDLMEDALDVISQDGDYMERTGMDMRIQCLFCPWAGPAIILDHHIRKEHMDNIHKYQSSEWNITFTLGRLVQQPVWVSEVLEDGVEQLYVLSVKYEDPDTLLATISSVGPDGGLMPKTAYITIYNKVTGKPYSWKREIQELPPNLAFTNDPGYFKVNISTLNLLPNSANLKLVNRELVPQSPTKVICGLPSLDDIHIIFFVKVSLV